MCRKSCSATLTIPVRSSNVPAHEEPKEGAQRDTVESGMGQFLHTLTDDDLPSDEAKILTFGARIRSAKMSDLVSFLPISRLPRALIDGDFHLNLCSCSARLFTYLIVLGPISFTQRLEPDDIRIGVATLTARHLSSIV